MKSKNFIKFIEKARSVHGYKYEYIEYTNMRNNIKLLYNGVIYYQNPYKHLMGRCPEKSTPKISDDEFISKSKETWGNRFDYSKTVYRGALKNIIIIDKTTGIEYSQRANSHLNGIEPFKKIDTDKFIKLSMDKYGHDYDYSLTEYKNYHEKLKIIYKKTGEVFEQSPSNHLSGTRPENLNYKNSDIFIKESILLHDNKYSYEKVEYLNVVTKVIITCPIHGDFPQTPRSHLSGSGCPSCNESKGEKEIAKFLNKHKITFDRQHKFPECKNTYPLPFDFYIPSIRTCIEFDGLQHFQPIPHFGGLPTYESLKVNDRIKSDYCEENYIDLIRIRYDQYDDIYRILWDNLKNRIK